MSPKATHPYHEDGRSNTDRRTLLHTAGVGSVAALGLTACGSSDSGSASSGSGVSVEPSLPSEPVDVAAVSDIPVGKGISVDKSGVRAVIGQPTEGKFTAFAPQCPHEGCKVNPANQRFVCPCHSSAFDMSTGDVLGGPAPRGLTALPVKVSNGRVIVG